MKKNLIIYLLGALCLMAGLNSAYSCKKKPVTPDDDPTDTTGASKDKSDVIFWLTTPDKSYMLEKPAAKLMFDATTNQYPSIVVDTTSTFQSIDGFGCTLTGGSAFLINQLPVASRNALMKELFSNDSSSIGISYLRVSIGASDLDAAVFSYDDMLNGQTDIDLAHFSINPDKTNLIPILKLALSYNPDIKILGSPWSAPAWMKNNKSSKGGKLLPEYYDAYARYLVKYIQGMQAEGIRIDAITIQNEPLNPNNNPSMEMQSAEQAAFIKNNLGPAFQSAGITTKIILYDHNCDRPDYPINILNDAAARPFIDGSAFHLYGGDISALSQVHDAYPNKNVYFTEQWVGGPGDFGQNLRWHVKNLIIGATRNWSKNVLEWNLASDPDYNPHTPGGCTTCEGAVTISSLVVRNVSYYIIAHASKFVPAGSVRIGSNFISNLQNVAFKTPDGKKVVIVLNDSEMEQSFNVVFNGKKVTPKLSAGSVATFIW
jgi:glucosylceramidase